MHSKQMKQLITERPKLGTALVANEIRLRKTLKKARNDQGLTIVNVAGKLGWNVQKVMDIESITEDIRFSDLRAYMLAIDCWVDFQVRPSKALP
jgi:hypothetical protein